jgi:hypothetical protein
MKDENSLLESETTPSLNHLPTDNHLISFIVMPVANVRSDPDLEVTHT